MITEPKPFSRPPRPPSNEAVFDIGRVLALLARHGLLIAATTIVTVLANVVYTVAFVPERFEGVAMITVSPASFTSKLKTESLSPDAYQRLLESDVVINETRRRAIAAELLSEDRSLAVGGALRSKIHVRAAATRNTEQLLSPLIEAIATHGSSETAAALANLWAEVFIEKSRERSTAMLEPTVALVESEYQRHRDSLRQLRDERLDTQVDFQKRRGDAELRWVRKADAVNASWDHKLVATRKESTDLAAAYQTETRRLLEAHASRAGLYGPATADGSDSLDEASREVLRQLAGLRVQLAQTVPVLTLEKSISEDAIWQALSMEETPTPDLETLVGNNRLTTEEVNPVSTELSLRLASVEARLLGTSGADPRAVEIAAELESLQRTRNAGLVKLVADRSIEFDTQERARALELASMARARRLEIDAIDREWRSTLDRLNQDVEHKAESANELAALNEQATLAKNQRNIADIKLGARAVPAQVPQPRGLAGRLLVAAVLGLALGIAIVLFRAWSAPRLD